MAQGRVRGRKTTLLATAAIIPLLCGALTGAAHAQLNTITGSGSTAGINSGFGGVIGQGSTFGIAQAGAGSNNLTLTLNRGAGGLNDIAVLYIATGTTPGTGFNTTAGFNDNADGTRTAISARGLSGAGRADLTFAAGFTADYAIGFSTSQTFGGLWGLANGGANSLNFVKSVNLTPNNNSTAASYTMSLLLSDLGLTPGQSFDYVLTYLNPFDGGGANAFRSNEFNGVASGSFSGGNIGVASATLSENNFNRFVSVAATSVVPEAGALTLFAPAALTGMLLLRRRRSHK